MSTAPAGRRPPAFLRTLLDRYDPDAFDAPRRPARVRLVVTGREAWDVVVARDHVEAGPARTEQRPDSVLTADASTWARIASDLRGGMDAYREGRLTVRQNLHLAVGLLAATGGVPGAERLRSRQVRTRAGVISTLQAGAGEPVVLVHGLGATKASFLPTVAALAPSYRVVALDLPGFGDSDKPLAAPYDPPFFARAVVAVMDALDIERAHVVGHSMGGRTAIEVGLRHPGRAASLAMLMPSLAWRRGRGWAGLLRLVRPELGLVQPLPRGVAEAVVRRVVPGAHDGWTAVGVDEFLRSFVEPRGRAAFYTAAWRIYMEEPLGPGGFWTRLCELTPPSLFVWGRRDRLVPRGFARHVRECLPDSHHVDLDCAHVPQLERPLETHRAVIHFLREHQGVAA